MRALVQRVSEASVSVDNHVAGRISRGVLVFLGVGRGDTTAQADQLSRKVIQLRIFPDDEGRMNRSVADVGGEVLIVSQFTLYADTRKGNRPSYAQAATPEVAKKLYEYFIGACRNQGLRVESGVFQAEMKVHLVNVGPVTIMCSSELQLDKN